ncbi:hypothetical protein HYT59_01740 [Candidatus Woesebacteria bacterium]|nr:hypothetical protein [Candidatus Woesebacteria bacterium]
MVAVQEGNLYKCPLCGFHYQDKSLAEKCEAWCDKYKSCSVEITAHSEEAKKAKK